MGNLWCMSSPHRPFKAVFTTKNPSVPEPPPDNREVSRRTTDLRWLRFVPSDQLLLSSLCPLLHVWKWVSPHPSTPLTPLPPFNTSSLLIVQELELRTLLSRFEASVIIQTKVAEDATAAERTAQKELKACCLSWHLCTLLWLILLMLWVGQVTVEKSHKEQLAITEETRRLVQVNPQPSSTEISCLEDEYLHISNRVLRLGCY